MQHCSGGSSMRACKDGLLGLEVGALAWGFIWPLRALGGQRPRPFKKEPMLCPILLAPYLQPNMPTLASPHEAATLLHSDSRLHRTNHMQSVLLTEMPQK